MASNKSRASGVTQPASPTPPQQTYTGRFPSYHARMMAAAGGNPNQPPVNTMNPATAVQPPTQQNTPVIPGAITALTTLNDDQLAQLVTDAKRAVLPNHLADADDITQRFVYQAGLNEKPAVMDDAGFKQFMQQNNIPQSDILVRGVDPISFNVGTARFTYTAQNVLDMLKYSSLSYIGGKVGGQALGAGAYFGQTGGRGTGYGSVTAQAVLDPSKARAIGRSELITKANAFAKSHPKFAAALGGVTTQFHGNNLSVWALAMGYNVISDNGTIHSNGGTNGRVNIIDRSALVYRG